MLRTCAALTGFNLDYFKNKLKQVLVVLRWSYWCRAEDGISLIALAKLAHLVLTERIGGAVLWGKTERIKSSHKTASVKHPWKTVTNIMLHVHNMVFSDSHGLCLPVSARVWLRPQAAETITWSARASINFGASTRFVSPWPSWPLSLRPKKVKKEISADYCLFYSVLLTNVYMHCTDLVSFELTLHFSVSSRKKQPGFFYPSSTACPQWSLGDCELHRDQTPHSWPGHHSDTHNDGDPTDSGPGYGMQLKTQEVRHTKHFDVINTYNRHIIKWNNHNLAYCMLIINF